MKPEATVVVTVESFKNQALAHVGRRKVGHLRWYVNGEVADVEVAESFQRRGIATLMWETVRANGIVLRHSAERSTVGDAWAHAVGGELPPRAAMENFDD